MTGSLRAVIAKLVIFTVATLAMTGLLAAVIGNVQPFADFYDVEAEFSDATGLLLQDVVKVAGVNVGKVAGADVVIDEGSGEAKAVVRMQVSRDVDIPQTATAAIKFRNLLGQRMIVIDRDPDEPGAEPLPKDGSAVIPLERTDPAFDLGIVFNNLQPVLQTLNPNDLNAVSEAIVQIFGGREALVQDMVADLADVAEGLAARGPVVTDLVDEVSRVVRTLAARQGELASVLDSLDDIVTTLGDRSPEFARALDNLGVAAEGTAEIVEGNRPDLDRIIEQLAVLLAVVADHKTELDAALKTLPETTYALNRATTYGEWANLNGVCIAGICAPGFSGPADGASADEGSALADIFASAVGGESE